MVGKQLLGQCACDMWSRHHGRTSAYPPTTVRCRHFPDVMSTLSGLRKGLFIVNEPARIEWKKREKYSKPLSGCIIRQILQHCYYCEQRLRYAAVVRGRRSWSLTRGILRKPLSAVITSCGADDSTAAFALIKRFNVPSWRWIHLRKDSY
jgi:hypothetical protein